MGIELFVGKMDQAALIFPGNTGVVYAHQTAGCYCRKRKIEGTLQVLDDSFYGGIHDDLCDLFSDDEWNDQLDEAYVEKLHALFAKSSRLKWFEVDVSMLDESCDGWINVMTPSDPHARKTAPSYRKAVLIFDSAD